MKRCALLLMISVGILLAPAVEAADVLVEGAWGVSDFKGPFKNGWPVVAYLPPGTIIFKSEPKKAPFKGYERVQSHYGHWLHILENTRRVAIGGVGKAESRIFLFHDSILCLSQSDHIVLPPEKCASGGPVGKGWKFVFSQHPKKENWWKLEASFDDRTRQELAQQGLDLTEAEFELTKKDLDDLERRGYIVRLDRKHPLTQFSYSRDTPLYFECGQTATKTIKHSDIVSESVGGELSVGISLWGFLTASLSGKAEVKKTLDDEDVIVIKQSTLTTSIMIYAATMTTSGEDGNGRREVPILIEKKFECDTSGPIPEPGKKITSVRFRVQDPEVPEPPTYNFSDPKVILNNDEKIYGVHSPRPIFISVNSQKQQEEAILNIMELYKDVDVFFAHFVLANMNNSCSDRQREDTCAPLVISKSR